MNKIISYTLFESKMPHGNRWWDSSLGKKDRYWFNIPSIVVANSLAYPDFVSVIHLEQRLVNHPLYGFLDKLQTTGKVKVVLCEEEFKGVEAAIWRYKPLWSNFDVVLCRDIDSVPNRSEICATLSFINSPYIVSNIRSSKFHNAHCTWVMAGLCGFKTEAKKFLQGKTFNQFYSEMKEGWGSDQELLVHYFVDSLDRETLEKSFVDIPIGEAFDSCRKLPDFHAAQFNFDIHITSLPQIERWQHELLDIFDSHSSWAGQPSDVRGDLRKIMTKPYDVCQAVREIIRSDSFARKFYNV